MVSECPPLVEFPLSWPLEFEFAKYWPNLDFLFMELVDVDKGELYMTRESFQDFFGSFVFCLNLLVDSTINVEIMKRNQRFST